MLRAMSLGISRVLQNDATISSCSFLMRVLASVEVINDVIFAMIDAAKKAEDNKG